MVEQSDVLAIGGVVAILLGMVIFNAVMAQRPKARPAPEHAGTDDALLCRFVTHEGSVVGETVAFEGDEAILKQAGVFKAVPMAQLKPDGAELQLIGAVDWSEAEAAGAAWHERVKGEGAEAVAGELTRSQDVRAPALDALRDRQAQTSGEEE